MMFWLLLAAFLRWLEEGKLTVKYVVITYFKQPSDKHLTAV